MKILVVDDDQAVRESLRRSLSFNGYSVVLAEDGEGALEAVKSHHPELIVLDVMMPKMDGLEVCRHLRLTGNETPILILTARDSVAERVSGLDAGADDYLVKPFALEELLARVRSLIRRSAAEKSNASESFLTFGDLSLNSETHEVLRNDVHLSLTRTEFELLEYLMKNPRKTLTRTEILEKVWGYDFPTSGNALEVYIGYLRRKIESDGSPRIIHTVRGVGYELRQADED